MKISLKDVRQRTIEACKTGKSEELLDSIYSKILEAADKGKFSCRVTKGEIDNYGLHLLRGEGFKLSVMKHHVFIGIDSYHHSI